MARLLEPLVLSSWLFTPLVHSTLLLILWCGMVESLGAAARGRGRLWGRVAQRMCQGGSPASDGAYSWRGYGHFLDAKSM